MKEHDNQLKYHITKHLFNRIDEYVSKGIITQSQAEEIFKNEKCIFNESTELDYDTMDEFWTRRRHSVLNT